MTEIHIQHPTSIDPDILKTIIDMIAEAGQINNAGISSRVQLAKYIGYVTSDDTLVAVGALKTPFNSYRASVFAKAGVDDPERYPLELGWFYTEPAFRRQGIIKLIVAGLMTKIREPVFATVRVGNTASLSLLQNNGFDLAGQPYEGMSGKIVLLVRD